MRSDKTVYKLVVSDFQEVAFDFLKRELTEDEIIELSEEVDNHIDWYGAIQNAVISLNFK